MNRLPIAFAFDNRYAIPAAVAFFSLLNRAKSDIYYEINVLHSDIIPDNQSLLENVVHRFPGNTI